MKTSDADIIIHPGLGGGTQEHWYRRWTSKLKTANVVEQDDWDNPDRVGWVNRLIETAAVASRPVVLIGHSLGVLTIAHAAQALGNLDVKAAFLVAPPDPDALPGTYPETASFCPAPQAPLPFPSFLLASTNDPYCNIVAADDLAAAWGSLFIEAGESGHINAESGHGPWPEGLMVFARLMGQIK